MSKIPPSLLYLTIYNPTLRPNISTDDDEDAEEQAQILFYVSRDRAVSRDKMLRQVGLAKALVNFAELFHSTDPCQNVHSQSRRMVMVSPEPNFWMHVAIELAKTPRAPAVKPKTRDKGKGKAKEEESSQLPQLEYHDGTLHDTALRAHLLRGYEQFKLTHGSFSSILSTLGQQALELQLERFFTVWAWTWDLDKDLSLSIDLGLPLHPSYPLILPTIDNFSSKIPEGVAALVMTQSHVAPSSRYRSSQYPVALTRHLMHRLAPTPGPATLPVSTTQPELPDDVSRTDQDDRLTVPNTDPPPPGGFLGVSISMSMDVRKWTWPSFGKAPITKDMAANTNNDVSCHVSGRAEAQVDQGALEDAISSDNSFGLPTEKPTALDGHEKHPVKLESDVSEVDTPRPSRAPSPTADSSVVSLNCTRPGVDASMDVYSEKPRFTWIDVFLAPSLEPLATSRRRVYLFKRGSYAVALFGVDSDDVNTWAESTLHLLEDVERIVSEDSRRNKAASLPSATKILQPNDSHILKTGDYVNAGGETALDSDYLFEAKRILDRDPAVIEVFCRGLHPQHWHVASRIADPVEDEKGEAYLEVSRKEATLSDVDNILRGLYKTHV
ncbi:hypothetical protein L210DRAFT_3640648 [Boletus edulis BED1]|uniref:CCZ1/INTU/HSP4 first Longin domain-containing protein n=1 Tax=Boletus edulis BED1 TaxID=1328754 RepID=A0AAD4C4W5_BOLED|nr:hypothetical protein L210DRAFT_3640648 [Boletus edulis BED1]